VQDEKIEGGMSRSFIYLELRQKSVEKVQLQSEF